jgi:cytochrome c oxidase cbb3-type subunit III
MTALPARILMAAWLACAALAACGGRGAGSETTAPAALPHADAAPPAIRYSSHIEAGGLPPPGGVLKNPHAGDAAAAKAGATLFTAMNCDGCHGGDAGGWVGPNLTDGRWRYGGADDEVFTSIFYGRPRGMPAFGGAVGIEGVWTLVTYIRSLPPPKDVPTESWEKPQ